MENKRLRTEGCHDCIFQFGGVHLVVKVGLQKQTRTQGLFAVFAFPGAFSLDEGLVD